MKSVCIVRLYPIFSARAVQYLLLRFRRKTYQPNPNLLVLFNPQIQPCETYKTNALSLVSKYSTSTSQSLSPCGVVVARDPKRELAGQEEEQRWLCLLQEFGLSHSEQLVLTHARCEQTSFFYSTHILSFAMKNEVYILATSLQCCMRQCVDDLRKINAFLYPTWSLVSGLYLAKEGDQRYVSAPLFNGRLTGNFGRSDNAAWQAERRALTIRQLR